jgi:hypothetical protein
LVCWLKILYLLFQNILIFQPTPWAKWAHRTMDNNTPSGFLINKGWIAYTHNLCCSKMLWLFYPHLEQNGLIKLWTTKHLVAF